MKFRLYVGLYNIVHTPRLHHHPKPNSIVHNVLLKISALLLFIPVEEKRYTRTVLACLLFLCDIFLLKNLVASGELLRADISIVMYIRLSVYLSVLLHGTAYYSLGNFREMVKIGTSFDLT